MMCAVGLFWTAPGKTKKTASLQARGGRACWRRERRTQDTLLGVLLRAGGSSGAGWPSRFLSVLGSSEMWHLLRQCREEVKFSSVSLMFPDYQNVQGQWVLGFRSPGTVAWGWQHSFLPSPQVQVALPQHHRWHPEAAESPTAFLDS